MFQNIFEYHVLNFIPLHLITAIFQKEYFTHNRINAMFTCKPTRYMAQWTLHFIALDLYISAINVIIINSTTVQQNKVKYGPDPDLDPTANCNS